MNVDCLLKEITIFMWIVVSTFLVWPDTKAAGNIR